jgi:flavin reductase (DIM6/NTAB) family NADH-FMN oxidoreductase RutF
MMGVPHPVVVVTTCKDVDWPFPKELTSTNMLSPYYTSFCGATISSFTSVTLGPPPVISFNLRKPSRTLRGILRHKKFRINMLKADGHGAAVAQAFISGNHEDAFAKVARGGHCVELGVNTSSQDPLAYSQIPPPLLRGRGIRGYLLCRALPEKFVDVGDHVVIIAEVLDVFPSFTEKMSWNQLGPEQQDRYVQEIAKYDSGLVYCERKYTKISEPIKPIYFH